MNAVVKQLQRRISARDRTLYEVFQSAGILFASSAVNTLLGLIHSVIIARLLGVEGFGLFSLVTAFTYLVNQVVDSRAWETAIKYVTERHSEGDKAGASAVLKFCYLVDGATAIVAVSLIVIAADAAARLFIKDISSAHLIRLFSLVLILEIPIGTSSAIIRAANRAGMLAYQQVGTTAIRLCLTTAALALNFGVPGLLLAYLVASLCGSIIALKFAAVARKSLNLPPLRTVSLNLLKGKRREMAAFLGATNLHALVKIVQGKGDVLLLGVLLSPVAVGYYQLGRKIAALLGFPTTPLDQSTYPEFFRLARAGAHSRLRKFMFQTTILECAVAATSTVFVVSAMHWVIYFSAGAPFLPAVPVARYLCVGTGIAVACGTLRPFVLARGGPLLPLFATSLAMFVQLSALLLCVPHSGLMGAGVAHVASVSTWLVVMLVCVARVWPPAEARAVADPGVVGRLVNSTGSGVA